MRRKFVHLVFFSFLLIPILASSVNAELVAHWKFDDGSGTVAVDSSGNGHDGTLLLAPEWVAGKFGGALAFGGISGQRVEMEGYDGILGTQNRTAMAWVKTAVAVITFDHGQVMTTNGTTVRYQSCSHRCTFPR